MKSGALLVIACLCLSACALLGPGWHWEKPGGGQAALEHDRNVCKARVYSGSNGEVTQEGVRRMHACMEGLGWSKVRD